MSRAGTSSIDELAEALRTESPAAFGRRLERSFGELAALARPVSSTFERLAARTGLPADAPTLRAGRLLAARIDTDGPAHPYHGRRHLCEVMVSAWCLAVLNELPAAATGELILAALLHDHGHDGSRAGASFRLERRAVELGAASLAEGGLDPGQCARIEALVLGTQFSHGAPHVAACHRWHAQRQRGDGAAVAAPTVPAAAPELARLALDAGLCFEALILCEADVLPSVGVTPAHAIRLQAALADEWGDPLDPADKLRFLDQGRDRWIASRWFVPNMDALAAALRNTATTGSVAG